MPNTERAFELLDDNRFDDRETPTCLWCSRPLESDSEYCSSRCEAQAQNDSEEDGLR